MLALFFYFGGRNMKSTAKAEAWMRDLKERLEFRIQGSSTIDTVREAKDSNGWPVLFLSDGGVETAGNPVIGLRIQAADAVSKNVFGEDLLAFTPHELELAYELDVTEGEPSRKDLIKVMLEASKLGLKLIVKEIADGTAVTAANMTAAAVAASHEAEVVWPTKGM